MEKRSRRRTRDLVTQPAIQGLSENEIGCARISMMARSKTAPFKGRIQKRKTKRLHSPHLACNTRPVHTDGSNATGSSDQYSQSCPLCHQKRRSAAKLRSVATGQQETYDEARSQARVPVVLPPQSDELDLPHLHYECWVPDASLVSRSTTRVSTC